MITPPNGSVVIKGYQEKKLPYHKALIVPQATRGSSIPSDLNITPSLHLYEFNQCCNIAKEVSNVTTWTVSVSQKSHHS